MQEHIAESQVAELVAAAAAGNEQAWSELVARYSRLVGYVAGSFRLSQAQEADVVATTWLRLVEHIGQIRDASSIGSWLATTARREALAAIRHTRREQPAEFASDEVSDLGPSPMESVLGQERDELVRRALARLPERQRALLTLLSTAPELSYEEVGAALSMPVGSIGPTRARALQGLRAALTELGALDQLEMR
jgi:RNA polymerase sigma factor (sigma-70 family)